MNPGQLLHSNLRVLFFRASAEELQALGRPALMWGLAWTWLAGMGRYWDHPNPHLLQRLGLGSLIYVFVLAAFLWAVLWPLRPKGHSFTRLLTYITLVSPPALLYAIPVERFMSLKSATQVNVMFLAVVAAWRLALLFRYLRVAGHLSWPRTIVGALMPMMLIVAVLALLNLEKAVFNIMGGLTQGTANDGAYLVVLLLAFFSVYAFPVCLLAYLGLAGKAWREAGRE